MDEVAGGGGAVSDESLTKVESDESGNTIKCNLARVYVQQVVYIIKSLDREDIIS